MREKTNVSRSKTELVLTKPVFLQWDLVAIEPFICPLNELLVGRKRITLKAIVLALKRKLGKAGKLR